jgi:hypothetical protein
MFGEKMHAKNKTQKEFFQNGAVKGKVFVLNFT